MYPNSTNDPKPPTVKSTLVHKRSRTDEKEELSANNDRSGRRFRGTTVISAPTIGARTTQPTTYAKKQGAFFINPEMFVKQDYDLDGMDVGAIFLNFQRGAANVVNDSTNKMNIGNIDSF
ncbi:hypothetical protein BGZ79_009732, partial [Entomortierella chlamydospora]